MNGQDPVEEVTVQLGNLEITIRVRQLGGSSETSSVSGFELVGPETRASAVVLPIADLDRGSASSAPPSLEQRVLEASSAEALAGLPLEFLGHLRKKLTAADPVWSPAARIGRAYRAGLVARKHLDGEYCDKCSPHLPIRNTIYLVLRTPGFLTGFWTGDFSVYQRLVINCPEAKNGFSPTSVSHAFPTRTEADAFLAGAQCVWPPLHR